jgi:CBS domain-containing protein
MAEVLKRAAAHRGTSFVEVYQNCVIFNDKAWGYTTDSKVKDENVLVLENGQPMVFGKDEDRGIRISGLEPEVVSLDSVDREELLVHNEEAPMTRAYLLSRMRHPQFPEPIGVFRAVQRPIYEEGVIAQVEEAKNKKGAGDLRQLYHNAHTWEVLHEVETDGNGHKGKVGVSALGPSEFDEEYVGVLFEDERTSEPFEPSLINDTLAGLKREKLLTAPVDISLAEAIDRLKADNAAFLALVDEEEKLVGVFTKGDVFAKVACNVEELEQEKVKDYMSTEVTALTADTTIAYALHLMSIHRFRHIPIIDDQGRPQTVVSFRSVIHYLETHFAPDSD